MPNCAGAGSRATSAAAAHRRAASSAASTAFTQVNVSEYRGEFSISISSRLKFANEFEANASAAVASASLVLAASIDGVKATAEMRIAFSKSLCALRAAVACNLLLTSGKASSNRTRDCAAAIAAAFAAAAAWDTSALAVGLSTVMEAAVAAESAADDDDGAVVGVPSAPPALLNLSSSHSSPRSTLLSRASANKSSNKVPRCEAVSLLREVDDGLGKAAAAVSELLKRFRDLGSTSRSSAILNTEVVASPAAIREGPLLRVSSEEGALAATRTPRSVGPAATEEFELL